MNPEAMAYDRNLKDLHVQQPVFVFPGDAVIHEDAYIAVMSNTYLRKLPFATMLMERFALPAGLDGQECIKRGLVCMGWLDHMLDEAPDRAASHRAFTALVDVLVGAKQAVDLPAWIRPEVWDSVVLLSNAVHGLPQENKAILARKAQRIGVISLEKSSATTVDEYTDILAEEGALSSDVVVECLDAHVQNTPAYGRLHAFNARAMVAATLLDAAIDLRQDYKHGLTGVAPSLRNHFLLYRKALCYVPYIVKNLGVKGVLTMLKVGLN